MPPRKPRCFFATCAVPERPPLRPCTGQLVRCHLIPRHVLRSTQQYKRLPPDISRHWFLYDEDSWVWGCGGPTGCSGHHGMFDISKTIRVPRHAIPPETEQLARRLGLEWYLDRTYGERKQCTAR